MKVEKPDAFLLNLKMIFNDLARVELIAERAGNASEGMDDYVLTRDILATLRDLRHSIRDRILEDVG